MALNPQNLIPQSERTKDEQREIARQGGIASGKARREKKKAQETARAILDTPLKAGEFLTADEIASLEDVKGANITVRDAALYAQAKKALGGDTKAFELLIALTGEKPAEQLEINADIEKQRNRIIELMSCKDELLTGREATD